ncbi:unnamed protein product [Durusdinium trenchii]|uniref:WW domain-containing protein n=1 Tax=Durusdinium trenchii TaxID=1381693 RepID=A0ABP0LV41_9DINO
MPLCRCRAQIPGTVWRFLAQTHVRLASGAANVAPPLGWKVCYSERHGKEYFWNPETRKSQWERPESEALLPPDWRAVYSKAHGQHYYWHCATGATQWMRPEATEATEPCAASEPRASVLPNGWEAVWSSDHDRYYYWHAASQQSTWDLPKASPASPSNSMRESAAPVPSPRSSAHRETFGWRKVLHSACTWEELEGEEFNLVKELLSHHPNVTEKIGSGLRGLKSWIRARRHGRDDQPWKVIRSGAHRARLK